MSSLEHALEREAAKQTPQPRSGSGPWIAGAAAPHRIGNAVLTPKRKAMERARLLPYLDQSAVNAYKLLRTRLLQRMRNSGWRTLIVTSIGPNEGKTTTAINLALAACNANQGVLLVDLDLKRPAVARSFGFERRIGLSDYLRGRADADAVLYDTDIDLLAVIPNFDVVASHGSVVEPRMVELAEHLREAYPDRLIVFDMSPVLASDDVIAFAPLVDTVLLVIAEDRTSRALLQRANEMLEGIPLVGTVLNCSSEGDASFNY